MSRAQAIKNKAAAKPKPRPEFLSVFVWAGLGNPRSFMLFALLGIVMISGLSVVRTTHQNRVAFNELQQMKDQAVALDVAWGQLLIEQSTFGVEGRIEQKAVEQLDMRVPEVADIVMVAHD